MPIEKSDESDQKEEIMRRSQSKKRSIRQVNNSDDENDIFVGETEGRGIRTRGKTRGIERRRGRGRGR
jgi:hypothetical protein